MPYTLTMREFEDTARVRRMCIGNSDPIFVSDDEGDAQMVVLDAKLFHDLYMCHQVDKKLEESENDFAEGRYQDAYEMVSEVLGAVRVIDIGPEDVWEFAERTATCH